MPPQDPLFNYRDVASRELITHGLIYDCFGTNFPLLAILKAAGVTETVFRGTSVMRPYLFDYANGSATSPGATITPRRKQTASAGKWDERFYESDMPVEETNNQLYNAPGDTQIFSQEAMDTYILTRKIESMLEMDAYRHGQPSAGNAGGSAGVQDDRHKSCNGFDEGLNNGIDPSPFANVYQYFGGVLRNGMTGQSYNSTPFYCGTPAGVASSITFPILQGALAQLSVIGSRAKVGFTGPFGWGAMAVMFRTSSIVQQKDVTEGYDFGWRSVNFAGFKVHEDPLAPSSISYRYLPGGNPAAYGTASSARYIDGSGSNTRLSPFLTPTYTVNGAAVGVGTLSPTGSNIPSATIIDPGEVLYIIDPDVVEMTPPTPGSGWNWDTRRTQIPDNVSTDNRFLKVATNIFIPQPPHGLMIYGFKGVRG